MTTIKYKTTGTCSSQIIIDIDNNTIQNVRFVGGCTGNLNGISTLVKGMSIDDVIFKLKGIPCHGNTSCPDQLATALQRYKDSENKK